MPFKSQAARGLALCLTILPLAARAIIGTPYQMQLGNPSGASTDTNNHDHYLITRTVETIDYSDNLGEPNWASWDLTAADLGSVDRTAFRVDTNLPPNFYWVGTGEYSGSGYDRGHLCPSADRTLTTNDNEMVFLMSNMMPQTSDNNSGVWKNFETYCRTLVQSTNQYELLIICGPSGFTGARINTNGYVAIPSYTWKIAVVVAPGTEEFATNRITATNRVIAIKVPNTNGVSSVWQDFITSANQIQVDTGLTFFTGLPAEVAAALRGKVDGQTNPPPAIFAFSPATGSASNTVVITGTNFSAASAVAFNGAIAPFTVDSGVQITATVPTNAGSGFVSVTTPSGTAISTNTFTVLNNGGTVYSGVLAGWDVSSLPGGANDYGPSPFGPTTNGPGLAVIGLTRGSGVRITGSAAAGGWGGDNFTNLTASAAAGSNQFATFSLTATNGYKVSFSSISRFDYYRSPTGPSNAVLQYQVGSGAFTDITNLSYPTVSAGASIGAIDLSTWTDLQNVGANTNVTFRIVNYGGTSASGTWYIYNKAGTTALDLALQGTVTQVLTPVLAPTLSLPSFTNHQFRFTVTGSTGTNYIVQGATNLGFPVWISLATNPAPFQFTETNADLFPHRFYRATVGP
jgi:DNA/RNA endonuclease G (NUC1)